MEKLTCKILTRASARSFAENSSHSSTLFLEFLTKFSRSRNFVLSSFMGVKGYSMDDNVEIKFETKEKDDDREGIYLNKVKYLNKICIIFLRILGVLHESKKKSSSSIVTFTKFLPIFICYGLLASFVGTVTLHMVIVEKNVNVKFRKLPLVLYNVMVLVKYNCLLTKQKNIAQCMEYLEDDLKRIIDPYHRGIIESRVRYGKRFFIIICVFLHITVFYWRICVPIIKGKTVTAENITIRPLPSTGYYFNLFDDQVSPFYEMVFFLQCIAGLVTIYINVVICTLAVTFVMHICGQLEIFINLLESIVVNAETEKNDTNFKLAIAVKHHIRVRRNNGKFVPIIVLVMRNGVIALLLIVEIFSFLRMIENTMNPLYFMDIFGCCGVLIFLGYCLMMDWNTQQLKNVSPYVISLSSVTLQIFVFCFVGEQLTLQDEKVALKTCILEWNRMPYKKAKDVIPIVMLSNCRLKITAGTIMELSLHTFGQVMKTAVGYCNMMRTIMQ